MKRVLSILLALCLVIAAIPVETLVAVPYQTAEVKTDVSRYFYSQIPSRAKIFYEALDAMLKDGSLKKGDVSVELTDKIGQDALAGQLNGSVDLLSEYGAARDAFYMDHPSVFYVDFSAITIRITSDQSGYHLYMGPGRYPTYYAEGFKSEQEVDTAITAYNTALANLVSQASGMSDPADQVEAIHDYIAKHTTYRTEVTLYEMYNNGNQNAAKSVGMIRTAYGCLVNHEGVCESYTRAFKAAMDELGIPCVMIYGVYKHSDNVPEQHIWNAVEIDGAWYGVDVTMDDPINRNTQYTSNGDDGYENHEFMLVGEGKMAMQHFPVGIMSEANYEFYYPIMNDEDKETAILSDPDSPLQVRYELRNFEGEEGGTYLVSYMGMNDVEMKQQGYYLIMTNKIYDNVYGWITTDWYYVTSDLYAAVEHETKDGKNWTVFPMPHVEYVEFGVTDIPMSKAYGDTSDVTQLDFYFHGDPKLLLADSGMMHNEHGTYRSAPYAIKVRPLQNIRMDINGQAHHVVAQYDDILVLPEVYEQYCKTENINDPEYLSKLQSATVNDVKLKVLLTDYGVGSQSGTRPQDYAYLCKNLTLYHTFPTDGKPYTTIEFDFKPSEMWADDSVYYDFYLEGLVGAWSGKAPNSFGYGCAHPCAICCYRRMGFDYNCFGKPQLLTDSDLSLGELDDVIQNAEGTPFEEKLKSRLMLVVEDANQKDNHTMEDLAEKQLNDNVLSAASYNINLTLCAKQLANLKDGMSIRLTCGFPVGYGPEDAGVTFKAYHYIKDAAGNITGIEEIPCTITPYGLLIEVSSFSPFMIAAVEADPAEVNNDKTVVLVSDVGGKITVNGEESTVVTLKKGDQPLNITVTPDDGYYVETVSVSGTSDKNYTGNEAETFSISYDDIDESGSAIVSAKFIVKEVAAEQPGEPVVAQAVTPDDFTFNVLTSSSLIEGGELSLGVHNPNSAYTYRWYKGTTAETASMVGEGTTYTVTSASVTDSGTYFCKAVAVADSSIAEKFSTHSVNIAVSPAPAEGEAHVHNFAGYVSDAEKGHHKKCTGCDEVQDIEEHVFNSKGECELCHYIDQSKHDHVFDRADMMKITDEGHAKICTFVYSDGTPCEVTEEVKPHDYDDNGKCKVCGFVDDSEHVHNFETTWHYDDLNHYHMCQHVGADGKPCAEVSEKTAHTYDNNHTCTVCGYKMPSSGHEYDGNYVAEGDLGHYQTCKTCGSHSPLENHTYNDDGECTLCGHVNVNAHKHRHTDSKPVAENDQNHYYVCEFPGCEEKMDYEPHTYNTATMTCEKCGHFNFSVHEHVFDGAWVDGGTDGHYTVCTVTANGQVCTETKYEAHTYDETGKCNVCGNIDSSKHVHSFESGWSSDEDYHFHKCEVAIGDGSACDHTDGKAAHTWIDNGIGHVCSVCGYVSQTSMHDYTGQQYKYDEQADGHYQECTVCGHKNYTAHVFDTDGKCLTCGFVDDSKHVHSYELEWHYDEISHFHICEHVNKDGTLCSAKSDITAHVLVDNTEGGHMCAICGYKVLNSGHEYDGVYVADGDYGHYQTCATCGTRSPLADHIYDADGVCIVCQHFNFSTHTHRHSANAPVSENDQNHYYVCEFPGCEEKMDYEAHTYNKETMTCEKCGHFNFSVHEHVFDGAWVDGGTDGHYTVCTVTKNGQVCTERQYAAHTYDVTGRCEVCGNIDSSKHVHSFESGWSSDEDYHFHKCTVAIGDGSACDHTDGKAAHIWVDDNNGGHKCSVCGYVSTTSTHDYTGQQYKYDEQTDGHYQECIICGHKNYTEHTFDNTGKCPTCGYVDDSKHEHSYESEWHYDAVSHFHLCEHVNKDGTLCPEKSDITPHTWVDNAEGGHKCSVCGYVVINAAHDFDGQPYIQDGALGHYQECKSCGTRSTLENHEYDDDGTCVKCGYHDDAMHKHREGELIATDEQGHYWLCAYPGCSEKIGFAAHTYNKETLTCEVCQFFNFDVHEHVFHAEEDGKEFWKDNGKGEHYTVCTFTMNGRTCTQQSPNYAHDNDPQGVCKVCGSFTSTHDHKDYIVYYQSGSDGHYGVCEFDYGSGIGLCGEKTEVMPHEYGDDNVCDICGYKKTVTPNVPVNPFYPQPSVPRSITVDTLRNSDSVYVEVDELSSTVHGVYRVTLGNTLYKAGDAVRVRVYAPGATVNSQVLIRDGWEVLRNCSMSVSGDYVEFTVDAGLIAQYQYFAVVSGFEEYEEIDVPQQGRICVEEFVILG